MKRRLAMGLAILLAMPVLSTTALYAEETGSGSNTGSTDTSNQTSTDTKARDERITTLKAQLKVKLTTSEKTRIVAKCVASQGVVGNINGKVKSAENSRTEAYKNLVDRLTNLSAKLKAGGMDTTTLNEDIATLQTKIDTFNTDLTAFKQAITDLSTMSCKTDPEGFKAALETARTALQKVAADAAAIRSYVTDTIKPLLATIRGTLKKTEDQSTSNTGGNQ
jgi:chromosome segregation ATPase